MDTTFKEFAIPKLGEVKPVDIFSLERRKFNEKTVTDLVEALDRDGRFLQQIAVRDEGASGYRLIAGGNRLEAWKRHFGEQTPVPASIYPSDTPDALITVLEIEENLHRKELTAAERKAQTIRLAAALKKLTEMPVTPVSESGEAAETWNQIPSLPPARGGRGNKGMAQQVAEKLGIGKRAVNMRRTSAAAAIGEEIDLDLDSPEELERKADKRQRAEPEAERPKRRKPARCAVTEDATPAESQAGEIDSEIDEVWRAFSALSERKQLKIMLRACQLRGWALRIGRARRVPAVDEESELAEDLPAEVPPATDDAAVNPQAEERDDAADLGAEDLQAADDVGSEDTAADVSEPADQENLDAEDLEDDGDAVPEAADQEPASANLHPEHLQDAAVDTSEAADQELVDATKCAYCKEPFSSSDPPVKKDGRLYHRNKCVEWAKPIAIAA